MLRRTGILPGLALLLTSSAVHTQQQSQANTADTRKIIRDAGEANYSLAKHGVSNIQCSVSVNWAEVDPPEDWRDPERGKEVLASLEKSHFKVAIGAKGQTVVSVDTGQDSLVDGVVEEEQDTMHQRIRTFVQAWAGFMVQSMIPKPDDDYHLRPDGNGYMLTFSDAGANYAITINSKFEIERVVYKFENLNGEVDPRFEASPEGFVLTGLDSKASSAEEQPSQTTFTVQNQTIDGLILPQVITATVPGDTKPLSIRLTFSDYHVTKSQSVGNLAR
jgi:hypothetical protein